MSNLPRLSPLVRPCELKAHRCGASGEVPATSVLLAAVEESIVPVIKEGTERFYLWGDLRDLSRMTSHCSVSRREHLEEASKAVSTSRSFHIGAGAELALARRGEGASPVYCSAVRNLIAYCKDIPKSELISSKHLPYFGGATVTTTSEQVSGFIASQVGRAERITKSEVGRWANSAYYMGSKKNLGAFLVEAFSRFLQPDGVVIDLMCGSGAASHAFSTVWKTYASDAQLFCLRLAMVQGRGFTSARANRLFEVIEPVARGHAEQLRAHLDSWIRQEDIFFHSDIDSRLLDEYRAFVEETSCYPNDTSTVGHRLKMEVEARKKDPTLAPFCLFSAYFANVYFGVRQSVEIDSIRYAIDQLDCEFEKDWAMGALIATLSKLGSGYAGYFAEPVEPTPGNLPRLLETRAKSVLHEFRIRFTALALESEYASHRIEILPGPWQTALSTAQELLRGREVLVYLDAPYKREEYSRYYHVLETLVNYKYPSSTRRGRLPDKKRGERFRSTFFTRNRGRIEEELIRIISRVLHQGWVCAWSYSDNAMGRIVTVIEGVCQKEGCEVISFATPYQHKPQGRRKPKAVTEYCILFIPRA